MASEALNRVRTQIARPLDEVQGGRLSQLDLHARMNAVRDIAAQNGLLALEGLARHSAQLALLPGHRMALRSCLEHVEDALDSRSSADCTAILAAVAVRLG